MGCKGRNSPVDRCGGVLDEADHLLLDVDRLGLQGKGHLVDQRLDPFAVAEAARRLALWAQREREGSSSSS